MGKHLMLASVVLGWSSQFVVGIYSTGENITMIVFITPKMEYYTGQFPPIRVDVEYHNDCVTYLGPHTDIYHGSYTIMSINANTTSSTYKLISRKNIFIINP